MAEKPAEDPNRTLVYQQCQKINDEYFIVEVYENAEASTVTFAAFEVESSSTYELSWAHAAFEELFAADPDLKHPRAKHARYDHVIARLDFMNDGAGGRKLVLGNEPALDEQTIAMTSALGTGRMTYAERQRLRYEAERLEEKRAQNIASKSDKARKAFLVELHERRRMEHLKASARKKRIDEERAERREKRLQEKMAREQKMQLYRENDAKRQKNIGHLERERTKRDEERIKHVIEEDRARKLARKLNIEEAVARKREMQERQKAADVEQQERLASLEKKRGEHISRREQRYVERQRKYLVYRQQAIDEIAKRKQLKAERKAQYLYQKSAERAKRLKEDHEKAADWERLEDLRTQAELKREHERNMSMLERIEKLKQKKEEEDNEALLRKENALERRRQQEREVLDQQSANYKLQAERDEMRMRNIATLEAERAKRNQEYVEFIHQQKMERKARGMEKQKQLSTTRDKTREERAGRRKQRMEEEARRAELERRREQTIAERQHARETAEVVRLQGWREGQDKRQLELEAAKMQKRLADNEAAQKQHEDSVEKSKQWQTLEAKRAESVNKKDGERVKREQQRRNQQPRT